LRTQLEQQRKNSESASNESQLILTKLREELQFYEQKQAESSKEMTDAHGQTRHENNSPPKDNEHYSSKLLEKVEEQELLLKSMRVELSRYQLLESSFHQALRERDQLKEHAQNAEKLNEKMMSLQAKIQRFTEMEANYHRLQAEYESLQLEQKQWNQLIASIEQYHPHQQGPFEVPSGSNMLTLSAAQVFARITELEKEKSLMLNEMGLKTVEIKRSQSQLTELQEELNTSRMYTKKLEEELSEKANLYSRQEKLLCIVRRERDGYKAILSTYEDDALGKEGFDKMNSLRIKELESRLSELEEAYNASLQTCADDRRNSNANHSNGESLVAPGTKIVHLSAGPLLYSEMTELRKENESLRERLNEVLLKLHLKQQPQYTNEMQTNPSSQQLLEGSHDHTHISSIDFSVYENEILSLKKQLQEDQKKYDRLSEVTSKQIKRFFQIVKRLFGYTLEIVEKKCKLVSTYSSNVDDIILFEINQKGGLDLYETPFTHGLSSEIHTYLKTFHSIPAFLSQITLDAFGLRTYHPNEPGGSLEATH